LQLHVRIRITSVLFLQVAELWNVKEFYEDSVLEYGSSINNIEQLKEAFSAFASILLHGVVGPRNVNVDI